MMTAWELQSMLSRPPQRSIPTELTATRDDCGDYCEFFGNIRSMWHSGRFPSRRDLIDSGSDLTGAEQESRTPRPASLVLFFEFASASSTLLPPSSIAFVYAGCPAHAQQLDSGFCGWPTRLHDLRSLATSGSTTAYGQRPTGQTLRSYLRRAQWVRRASKKNP
jgi:hypothetical protein